MVEIGRTILPRSGFVHLARSKSLLKYNMIDDMVWISYEFRVIKTWPR